MDPNNTQLILDAGASSAKIQEFIPDGAGAPVVIVPTGYKPQVLDLAPVEKWLGKPMRKTGSFHFADVDSFIRYFNEHKTEDSRIFADITDTGAVFVGVLNFHGKEPSFNDHKCLVELATTHEWDIWTGNNKVTMTQAAFAQFLEENSDMFTTPSGADLLELVQELEGKNNVSFTSAIKLQNNQLKLIYNEEIVLKGGTGTQAGDMVVPSVLNVSIAAFEGTVRISMQARLRYRIENRKISFWYETVNAHLVVRQVCAELLAVIEKQTGLVPFRT